MNLIFYWRVVVSDEDLEPKRSYLGIINTSFYCRNIHLPSWWATWADRDINETIDETWLSWGTIAYQKKISRYHLKIDPAPCLKSAKRSASYPPKGGTLSSSVTSAPRLRTCTSIKKLNSSLTNSKGASMPTECRRTSKKRRKTWNSLHNNFKSLRKKQRQKLSTVMYWIRNSNCLSVS